MKVHPWSLMVACTAAIMLLSSCTDTYIPSDSSVQKISVPEARKAIVSDLIKKGPSEAGVPQTCYFGGSTVTGVNVTLTKLIVKTANSQTYVLPLGDIPQLTLNTNPAVFIGDPDQQEVALPDGSDLFSCWTDLGSSSYSGVNPASALYVLNRNAKAIKQTMAAYDAKFQSSLNDYRKTIASGAKLPERADMYRVQAEDAVRSKDFYLAQADYEKAVDVAPWWPQGHFNRAMLFGATGDYDLAIVELKYYLDLVPNAANARAAQYKIFGWQQKVDEENANVPAYLRTAQASGNAVQQANTSKPSLGVQVADVPKIVAKAEHLPDTKGAFVIAVLKGSVAEKAGIQPEDVIVSFAGNPVAKIQDLVSDTHSVKAGASVPIQIIRNSQRMKVVATF